MEGHRLLASEMGNNTLTVLANGLHDGGCEFVSYFPGSVSHIVAERLGAKRISLNEKIAFEEAYGASLGGKRAVVCMKNVGLSVAADPFLNSHLTGVNAGLVIVVFDDVYVASSQSRQDSRHFLGFFGGLWLEPYNTETLYTSGYQALSLSEQLDIPVVIRLTNPLLSSEDNYTYPRKKKETLKFNYPIERQKFIVHPTNWQYQRQQLSLRLEKVQKYIEARYDSVLSNCSGEVENVVIVLGASSKNDIQLYRNWEQLQLSTYPLPYTTILKFIKTTLGF